MFLAARALLTLVFMVAAAGPARAPSHLDLERPGIAGCPVFPASNVWNREVANLPAAANSDQLIRSIGLTRGLHPDFGSFAGYGIPYTIVSSALRGALVSFDSADESDIGPYPIPARPRIERGSDHHLLIVSRGSCYLYELYALNKTATGWHADSGAIWNLRSNALRPNHWTSADAAGLPILPGLVRYEEIVSGAISHALRFTAPNTRRSHIYPARHDAGAGNSVSLPAMGLRVRLKASVSLSGFSASNRVILTALKRYGMILADNGAPWYITGAPDPHWNDDDLHQLDRITGNDLEVVDTRHLRNG